jgi:hypothetical protein
MSITRTKKPVETQRTSTLSDGKVSRTRPSAVDQAMRTAARILDKNPVDIFMSRYFNASVIRKCSALVSLSSGIKPLLEAHLQARKHLFFNVFDVGELAPTSDIAVFAGALNLHDEFLHQPSLSRYFSRRCCLQMSAVWRAEDSGGQFVRELPGASPMINESTADAKITRSLQTPRNLPLSPSRGYTREAAIRPNSVTPQRTRNDRIAASDTAKQSVDDARSDKLTDLVFEC